MGIGMSAIVNNGMWHRLVTIGGCHPECQHVGYCVARGYLCASTKRAMQTANRIQKP
jgi:hypothetical protein